MRYHLIAASLSIGWVGAAAAQDNSTLIPSDREASAQVAKIVAAAEAAGLPTNPIVGKVRYGVAVARVTPERIVAAAESVASRLEAARNALAPNPTHQEIEAGAAALGEKATPEALRTVRRVSGSRPVATALGVLAQLLTSNVPLPRATEIVTDLIRRGASENQLAVLVTDVNADIANGAKAVAAIDVRAQGLIAVLAAPGSAAVTADFAAPPRGLTTSNGTRNDPPKPPKRP